MCVIIAVALMYVIIAVTLMCVIIAVALMTVCYHCGWRAQRFIPLGHPDDLVDISVVICGACTENSW